MFNTEKITQAKADFAVKRYCVIDNILEEKYINALYEEAPKMPYQLRARATGIDVRTYEVDYKHSDEFQQTLEQYIQNAKGNFSYFHHVYVAAKDKKNHADPFVTEFNHIIQ